VRRLLAPGIAALGACACLAACGARSEVRGIRARAPGLGGNAKPILGGRGNPVRTVAFPERPEAPRHEGSPPLLSRPVRPPRSPRACLPAGRATRAGVLACTLLALLEPACRRLRAGCTSDADCKGPRICTEGRCVDLPLPVPEAPVSQATVPADEAWRAVATPPPGIARVIARASPQFNALEVGRVPAGDSVEVLERSADGRWYLVRHEALNGRKGWIHRDVLSVGAASPR
jgi:hypothetical protein